MSKMVKSLVFFGLALVLTLSLVAVACAPKAPTGDVVPKADLTKAQADLAAEKQKTAAAEKKTKDVEAELAALKKPAKVYRWEPACEMPSGALWNDMNLWSKYVTESSNGRIVSTPSTPGAICPVEEQIEAAAAGTTGVMMSCPSYYPGKVPVEGIMNMSAGILSADEMMYAYEYFMDGRISKILYNALESRYNVKVFGTNYDPMMAIMSLRKPADRITDLKGRKFRCGDEHFAYGFSKLGVATVWAPSVEIYTMLATGAVDGFTFGGAADHYALATNEVAPYWLTNSLGAARCNHWVMNRDVWNELPEDLKSLCMVAVDAASGRGVTESYVANDQSWEEAIEGGVIPFAWPDEDMNLWASYMLEYLDKFKDDPEGSEVVEILKAFAKYKGRIE